MLGHGFSGIANTHTHAGCSGVTNASVETTLLTRKSEQTLPIISRSVDPPTPRRSQPSQQHSHRL